MTRVALLHDYLNQYGGAERVLEQLHHLYPEAPVFTSIYWPERMSPVIREMDVRTSFMQRLPGVLPNHQRYLPLYPAAFASFDLREFDLVISNCSAFCKGAKRADDAQHLSYCLTPMRWVWQYDAYVQRERLGSAARLMLPPVVAWLRQWDLRTNRRVDRFVAISRAIADRVRRFYGRDASVVHPPVDCAQFEPGLDGPSDYYLVLSRLVPYKRIDLAVDACTRLGRRLLIAGSAGRDEAALRARAGPTVEFLGRVSDDRRRELLSRCRAFLFPGDEDFGIAPLEANASGRPVIAYRGGGALDTIVEGETGLFFDEQCVESLVEAIQRFEHLFWRGPQIRAHAERFDLPVFRRCFAGAVAEMVEEGVSSPSPSP